MTHPTTRFALLRHDVPADFGRQSHWDLLLEWEDACWTWAMNELPAGFTAMGGSTGVPAKRLADHRKLYLEYEGPLSEGRGTVSRELDGECQWWEATATSVRVQLSSDLGRCEILLEQLHGDSWRTTTC
jgi:hypothetical protein